MHKLRNIAVQRSFTTNVWCF